MAAKSKSPKKASFANLINLPMQFDLNQSPRGDGRILVASGSRTRNRDYWTGKMLRFDPAGVRTDAWSRQGGLVLYMHDFNIPLAKSSIYLEGGKLWAPDKLNFHRRVLPIPAKAFASTPGTIDTGVIADLWEQRYINTVSIHITLDVDDEQNIAETEDEIFIGTSEMIEYSIVSVPGDRDAQRYQFMLDRGVREDIAQCLSCYVPEPRQMYQFSMEAKNKMDEQEFDTEEIEEEEVEEVEAEADEQEADTDEGEPFEVEVPIEEIVNALATNQAFINGLVNAVVGNPAAMRRFTEALAQSAEPAPLQSRRLVLKVVSDEQPAPAPTPQRQQSALSFAAKNGTPRKPAAKRAAKPQETPNIKGLVR